MSGAARVAAVAALGVALAACSTPLTTREKGALAGGAIGAGAGAIVGSQVGHTGTGALIGAGVGAVSGAVIGDAIQRAEQREAAASPPTAPPPPPPVAVAPPPPPPPPVAAVPPPVVVQAPTYIWVPQWGVYVLEGHDIVYDGRAYYYFYGGQWYIAQTYTGPWAPVTPPPAFAKLPRGHFHKHLPPGLAKKGKVPPGHRKHKH